MRRVECKRGRGDCASTALANLLGVPYASVLKEAAFVDQEMHGLDGLYQWEVIAIAARLGVMLKPKRKFDLSAEDGILGVLWQTGTERDWHGHWVAVRKGVVICPDHGNDPWQTYLKKNRGRATTLLRLRKSGGSR